MTPITGRQLKLRGLTLAERQPWQGQALRLLTDYLNAESLKGRIVRQDSLRQLVEDAVGPPPKPKAWGPLFRALLRGGRIRRHDYVESRIPSCHARPVPRYWVIP